MKSSRRPFTPSSYEVATSSWIPKEFPTEAPEKDLELAEKIIALFMPDQVDFSPGYQLKPGGGLVNYSQAISWNPSDIEYLPQVNIESPEKEFTLTLEIPPQVEDPQPTAPDVLAIIEQSETILDDARKKAEEILQEAREKSQEIEQFAFAQAYQKGLLSGEEDGYKKATEKTIEQLNLAFQIVEQFKQWKEEMLAQSENAVLGVIREMAKVMFGNGINLEPAILESAFNQIMENTRTLGPLKVYVNPEDAMNLNPYWRETQMAISGQQIQLIPSDAIQRGGCFVDGEFGSLDARVETQLQTMINTLQIAHQNA